MDSKLKATHWPEEPPVKIERQGVTIEVADARDLPPFLLRKYEQLLVMTCYCLRALADFRSEMLVNKLMSYLADFGVIMRYYNSDEYTGEESERDQS